MDARSWDERYAASELVWSAAPNQFVERDLAALRPGRALDLAAGEGRNALWLAGRGWDVNAVDFSQVALDKGRQVQAQHPQAEDLRVSWVRADVLTYRPPAGELDLVLVAYLQLHEDERRTALRNAFTGLRPGGTFYLVAHDSTNLTEGTGGPTSAAVLYTAEDVLSDLDGERFEVVHAERVERQVGGGGEHVHASEHARTAYDALVHLVRTE